VKGIKLRIQEQDSRCEGYILMNILDKQSRTVDKGWSSSLRG
jgi:hypothetical protein